MALLAGLVGLTIFFAGWTAIDAAQSFIAFKASHGYGVTAWLVLLSGGIYYLGTRIDKHTEEISALRQEIARRQGADR